MGNATEVDMAQKATAEETAQFTPTENDEEERKKQKRDYNNEITTASRERQNRGKEPVDVRPTWTPPENGITLRCMKDVTAEPVTWLWKPYIPIGKLALLEGDPGEGKSWMTLAIATAISLGKGLPGQATTVQGTIILVSAEDGLGDTVRPRLDALHADVGRIHAIDGALTFNDAGFALVESYIIEVKPTLLIIDPLVAYLGAGMDFHRANETRPLLARLAKLAEKYQLAILALRHLSKGGQNKAIYRGIGSIDLTAACRSVLLAGCAPEDKENMAIIHIKSNLARKGPSQGYQLRDDSFYWTGESTLTSAQILADDSIANVSAFDEAIAFLKDELADGPVPAPQVFMDAKSVGLSEKTINRAKMALGIDPKRKGQKGKQGGGGWSWGLPESLDGQDGHLNNGGAENINMVTKITGHLNHEDANKSTLPKNLAILISEKIVPEIAEIRDKPSANWQKVNQPDDGPPSVPPVLPVDEIPQNKLEQWEIDAGVWLDKDGNPNVGYKGGKSEKDN